MKQIGGSAKGYMDIESLWNKALKNTEIIRVRVHTLLVSSDTFVPYILLSESSVNLGDTVVRKGTVKVQKPSLILPPNNPQFDGFEFELENKVDPNSVVNFLLVRGVTLPSFRYDNQTSSLDIHEGKLSDAIKHYERELQQSENVMTGLLAGPEDCWPFSLLIFICSQIARDADYDIRKLLDEYRKNNKPFNS